MNDPLTAVSTRTTTQSRPADPRQVPNSAGGYTFEVADDVLVHRFLTLGTTGGTYYATEADLTADAVWPVIEKAGADAVGLVRQVLAVSLAGRAPRQNPAIFALAAAASFGDETGRRAALDALPQVCRTGTHLFTFARYREQFGGWGRGMRRAVAGWYTDRPVADVAYQALKYRQRDGWSHRDLLRLAHPVTDDAERRALFAWVTHGVVEGAPPLVAAFEQAQAATDVATWVRLIGEHRLSWEMLPDAALVERAVWEALLHAGLPQTALLRQLPRLTRLGVVGPGAAATRLVTAQLADADRLRRARVHPVNVLVALRTYASGRSVQGSATWQPVPAIVDALDAAFYAAFGAVEPAGRRMLWALDVSGSMASWANGFPVSCREVAAALALVAAATEPSTTTVGFSTTLVPLDVTPRRRLDDVVRSTKRLPFSATDCAQPMLWATARELDVDTFVVVTDNETWAGKVQPHQALAEYRQRRGIDARLAVVALTPTRFTIADPADPGMLDVSGFDAAVPQLVADFARGDV